MEATTAPDTGTDIAATTTDTTTTPDTGDLAAEVQKWQNLARKHEERAKANAAAAKELETLRAQSMTDQEKAVAAARTEARAEALREFGTSRVDDAIRVAAAGRNIDVDGLLEALDRARFIGENGEPDRAAIAAWIDRIAPKPDDNGPRPLDLGQGVRGGQNAALNGDPLERSLKQALGIR